MNVPFLGELALDPEVRIGGDTGSPVTVRAGGDAHAQPFRDLATRVEERCGESKSTGPSITIED